MADNKMFGQTEKLPDLKCPHCFTICNAALPLVEQQKPRVNSLVVCANCAKVSRVANNLMLARIPDNQLQQVLRNPIIARRIMALQLAAVKVIEQTSFGRGRA